MEGRRFLMPLVRFSPGRSHLCPLLRSALGLMAAGLAPGVAFLPLRAQTHWINPGANGIWTDPANWSAGLPRTDPFLWVNGTDGYIDNGGTAVVQSTDSARTVFVGSQATGYLQVQGGTLSTSNASVGFLPGGSGVATVASGATWNSSISTEIGTQGTGAVNVLGGGRVITGSATLGRHAGASGFVVVSGTWGGTTPISSSLLTVGNEGTGALTIASGGVMRSSYPQLGLATGGAGTVTVAGTWHAATTLAVGVSGTGILNLAGGGVVNVVSGTGTLALAQNAGSAGTLNIGAGTGAGTLNAAEVSGGGGTAQVSFNHNATSLTFAPKLSGSLGVRQEGTGTTILTGANTYAGGTTVAAGTLRAGSATGFASGTAYRVDGGTLDLNGQALTMSALSGSGGVVNLGGAALQLAQATSTVFAGNIAGAGSLRLSGGGTLVLGGTSTYNGPTFVDGGTLRVNGSLASAAVTVLAGATLGGSGSIGGNATIEGTLAPGNSAGTLTFVQGLTLQSTARLQLEIASRTQFDQLVTGGPLAYGGELWISFLDGYRPEANDRFSLVTAASRVDGSAFEAIHVGLAGYAGSFDYATGTLTVTRTAIPEPGTTAALTGLAALGLAVAASSARRAGEGVKAAAVRRWGGPPGPDCAQR